MDSHGFSWILIDFHGFSWIFMDSHGFSWIFMDSHGFSCFLYTTDLEPMVFRTHNCFMDDHLPEGPINSPHTGVPSSHYSYGEVVE